MNVDTYLICILMMPKITKITEPLLIAVTLFPSQQSPLFLLIKITNWSASMEFSIRTITAFYVTIATKDKNWKFSASFVISVLASCVSSSHSEYLISYDTYLSGVLRSLNRVYKCDNKKNEKCLTNNINNIEFVLSTSVLNEPFDYHRHVHGEQRSPVWPCFHCALRIDLAAESLYARPN